MEMDMKCDSVVGSMLDQTITYRRLVPGNTQ